MMELTLPNARGFRGETTPGIRITAETLQLFFEMDRNYREKKWFSLRAGGRKRCLNHITIADFQVLFALFRVCDYQGKILIKSRKSLYEIISDDNVEPISDSQFYESFEKLSMNGVFRMQTNTDNLQEITIEGYLTETGKIDRFVFLPPFIFSSTFNKLSVAEKKLILAVYAQAGNHKGSKFERVIERSTNFKPLLYADLCTLLKKSQRSHVVSIVRSLAEISFEGKKLFSKAVVSNGKSGEKAIFILEPMWVTTSYSSITLHRSISMERVLPKQARIIRLLSEQLNIGEITSTDIFPSVIKVLYHYPKTIIRKVLTQLREFVSQKGSFPDNIVGYVKSLADTFAGDSIKTTLEELEAKEFVTNPLLLPLEEQRKRMADFAKYIFTSKITRKKLSEKLLHLKKSILHEFEVDISLDHYYNYDIRKWGTHSITHLDVNDLNELAQLAYSHRVDPFIYQEYEEEIIKAIAQGENLDSIWKQAKNIIPSLRKRSHVPLLSVRFRLQSYL
ncbi:hypothetical protein [Paenibacillus thiaminolyticus]|uniref:Uncharacterized protein n=1 Tax=Paenibacillus thiaminolyticus TaxID=49283 RepID=A0A3A3GDH7_PANTH|nr:hypothetical protein [Paenibacillus thiaminolyticus]RJG15199.1 hypothetical protein DQX05_29835 [Paenibacillus thiaminolyticus]